jgi:hypothetical protein
MLVLKVQLQFFADVEIDRIIYEKIYAEAESIVDFRHFVKEGDITSLDDPTRNW